MNAENNKRVTKRKHLTNSKPLIKKQAIMERNKNKVMPLRKSLNLVITFSKG